MGDWCNRCLDLRDVRMEYIAEWDGHRESFAGAGQAAGTAQWAEACMETSGGDAIFSLGSAYRVLVPVTTWHGDPICQGHLMECHDRELRSR